MVMDATASATAYLFHAWIRGIHPMLWRRFLVADDSTLANLHYIAMSYSDGPIFTCIDFEFEERVIPISHIYPNIP